MILLTGGLFALTTHYDKYIYPLTFRQMELQKASTAQRLTIRVTCTLYRDRNVRKRMPQYLRFSYLPVVVDSFHSAFKQLFLFTWLDVTFTHLRLSFSFLKLLTFIFNSHRSSFLLLETCLLGDSAPLFLLACHSVISVLSEVIPASFDDTSYLT